MDSKKKRVTLTLKQKLDVLDRIEMGEPIKDIADEFGVGKSTLCLWKRKRPEIENIYMQARSDTAKRVRRSAKQVKAEELDEELYRWYSHQLAHNSKVTTQTIRHKAVSINEEIGGDPQFQPTDAWISAWKQKFKSMSERGKRGRRSCDHSKEMNQFLAKVRCKILTDNYVSEQLYHIGETALNLKTIPRKGLDSRSVKILSTLSPNQEEASVITLWACSNSVGSHKLPLTVLSHPSSNGENNTKLVSSDSVYHRLMAEQKSVGGLLETWFYDQFVPRVSEYLQSQHLPQKAILFVDCDSPFSSIEDRLQSKDITVIFIPSQSCSHFHPMRQGIMNGIRKKYRKNLASELMHQYERENVDLNSWLEAYTIEDSIKSLCKCWDFVSSEMLIKSWQNLVPGVENYYESPIMVSLDFPALQAHYIFVSNYLESLVPVQSKTKAQPLSNGTVQDENSESPCSDESNLTGIQQEPKLMVSD